jgi:hypothetical protein
MPPTSNNNLLNRKRCPPRTIIYLIENGAHLEHGLQQEPLQDAPQAAGPRVERHGLLGDCPQAAVGEVQHHVVLHAQHLAVLARNRVLGLDQNLGRESDFSAVLR